jgi:glycosyl-4,4'-diaponeurosporenoate acyltransferase
MLPLPDGVIVGLCVVGWSAWSLSIGFLGHRLPLKLLETDTCLTRPRIWGENRHGYDRVLRIKHWKDRLPEAGDFFPGGFRKSSVSGGDRAVMSRFLAETRRAEYVHLAIWPFWLVTMLWTPGPGVLVNLVVGTAFNLPCVWVQRYNRLRLQHLLALKELGKTRRSKEISDRMGRDVEPHSLQILGKDTAETPIQQ